MMSEFFLARQFSRLGSFLGEVCSFFDVTLFLAYLGLTLALMTCAMLFYKVWIWDFFAVREPEIHELDPEFLNFPPIRSQKKPNTTC